jgi:hypothetical protein
MFTFVCETSYQGREHNADYLFVGRRGQGLLKRALLGSVSDYLIRHCETASVSLFHDCVERPNTK